MFVVSSSQEFSLIFSSGIRNGCKFTTVSFFFFFLPIVTSSTWFPYITPSVTVCRKLCGKWHTGLDLWALLPRRTCRVVEGMRRPGPRGQCPHRCWVFSRAEAGWMLPSCPTPRAPVSGLLGQRPPVLCCCGVLIVSVVRTLGPVVVGP